MKIRLEEFDLKHSRSVPIWSCILDDYETINLKIIEEIQKYRSDNKENYTDSININVWQSGWEMHTKPVFDIVGKSAIDVTKTISKEYFNFPIFTPEIVDCWVNVYNRDSGCRVHQHFPATFSLVYYVAVPEKSGDIYFPDIGVNLTPQPGLLLCFRGDLWHGVQFNFTENDRIIIGINVIHKHS